MYALTRIRSESAALALGLALAAAFTLSWRVSGETQVPSAHVEVLTSSSSDFAVTPDGLTSGSGALTPTTPEGGFEREVTVRNATAEPLGLRIRLTGGQSELDEAVQARVGVDNRVIFDGALRGLAAGTDSYALAPGQTVSVSVLLWIPESTADGKWEARSATLPLDFVSTQVGG
jgi:hypothetical protein